MVGFIATSVCWLAVVALVAFLWWPVREAAPQTDVAAADSREWWRA